MKLNIFANQLTYFGYSISINKPKGVLVNIYQDGSSSIQNV